MALTLAMQGSVRGYLLTGDESFLGGYEAGTASLPQALDRLVRLTADNPRQATVLADLRAAIDDLLDFYRQIVAGSTKEDQSALILVRDGRGEVLMQAVRSGVDTFVGEEQGLLYERQRSAELLRRWTLVIVFTALLSAIALAVWLSNAMRVYVDRLVQQSTALERETELRRQSEATLVQAQKMEAVGQLAGGIAHDFNNMLTVVLGNIATASRRLDKLGEPGKAIAPSLEAARQGAQAGAKLTHRLLAFSRRQPLAPSRIDLDRVVAGVADLIRRTIGADIALETVLSAGLWPAYADSHQLENVIINLVVNARDAMPDGGRVTIETANAYLDERYAARFGDVAAGQYVLLSVTDTGSGIPPELIARVFEPFFTTKAEGEGTGLGLAMVHGFVKQSGGHVRIYSEPGEGTTVKLYLPRHADNGQVSAPVTASREEAAVARGSEGILVVEDNAEVRAYAREALEDAGYAVVEAANAEEALARLADGARIDLVFTDVVLGTGLNGRQLADQMAARSIDLPILFTTGYSRSAIFHNGRLDAGVHLLEKPYTQTELTRRIRVLLEGKGGAAPSDGT
jgi:signal transduction histidine kinase/CheY-like chemotaxis protein